MRLTCVAPGYPYRGGISHFATRLAQQLSHHHDCRFINFTRLYPGRLYPGRTQFQTRSTDLTFPSELMIDSISPLSWIRTGRSIRDWKPDAIIFHWYHPFFAAAYRGILSFTGKKAVRICICHNVHPHDEGKFRRLAVRWGLSGMHGFVVHASQQEDELESLIPGSRRIVLFHPIYDIFPGEDIDKTEARKRLGLDENDRVVLYFGLIRPYKGVEVLLKAGSMLKDVHRLKILIVGEIYSNKAEIIKLVNSLPDGMVRMVDEYIPNEDVSTWFRASDLVALPYISATQSGVVPLAYRFDRPVVVTRVGGLPEVVDEGESGYLVEPGDAEELANQIRIHFIEKGNPCMSEGIGRMRERLSWDRYASELEGFISSIKETRR